MRLEQELRPLFSHLCEQADVVAGALAAQVHDAPMHFYFRLTDAGQAELVVRLNVASKLNQNLSTSNLVNFDATIFEFVFEISLDDGDKHWPLSR